MSTRAYRLYSWFFLLLAAAEVLILGNGPHGLTLVAISAICSATADIIDSVRGKK